MSDKALAIQIIDGSIPDSKIVDFNGPLTLNNLFPVKEALNNLTAPVVILDLSKVDYVDSAGIGMLVHAHVSSERRGGKFALVGVNPRPRTVMEVTRVITVFHIFANIAEAEQAFKA